MTVIGIFDPAANPAIAERRGRILFRRKWYPAVGEPATSQGIALRAAGLARDVPAIRKLLNTTGFATVQLDRSLDDGEFIEFGRSFGTLMPESAAEISDFISRRYILDLQAKLPPGAPTELQPFAEDPLTFHTEGSRRPTAQQPTLLVFQCIVPPVRDQGGQTLLRSAAQVSAMLAASSRAALADMTYDLDGMPPIYRDEGGGTFSFRDFGDSPTRWRPVGSAGGLAAEEVGAALSDLLLTLYDERYVRGIWWQANGLVLIDNRRFFHGRSSGADGSQVHQRHLRRLRIR